MLSSIYNDEGEMRYYEFTLFFRSASFSSCERIIFEYIDHGGNPVICSNCNYRTRFFRQIIAGAKSFAVSPIWSIRNLIASIGSGGAIG